MKPRVLFFVPLVAALATAADLPTPQWIWAPEAISSGEVTFTKTFSLPAAPKSATLKVTADDFYTLNANGKFLFFSENWRNLRNADLAPLLKAGENTLILNARNAEGPAGLIAWLDVELADGSTLRFASDESWSVRPAADESTASRPAVALGPLGMDPWGDPWSGSGIDHISVPDGFVVEKLYDVPAAQGSWVVLANDGRGGFYVSDEKDRGIFHFTVQNDRVAKVTPVPAKVTGAQGLQMVGDALYAHVSGTGLLRLTDSDGDGIVDSPEELPSASTAGEHGIHALVPSPKEGELLVVGGNAAKTPPLDSTRIPVSYENDLIERTWDPRLIARKAWVAPAGWIASFDPAAETYGLISVGYRNAYDVAANSFGDLFTYDSDEEWDLGMPWYRPTRICLASSGSDYGWRSGSDNWPRYYEDSLPPLLEIGPGSPTGMLSARDAAFPARYRNAIFALDWTYGTMRALHLEPKGSAYEIRSEDFVVGTPLPMTDAVIAEDGSMIFITGGRQIASAVFRVRYAGSESTEPAPPADSTEARTARELRHRLETFHGAAHPDAVETAWPHLASPDRFLRYAARVAVEWQPVASWKSRLETETRPQAVVTGVVALARMGTKDDTALAQRKLDELDLASLDEELLLGWLRAQSLVWERLDRTSEAATIDKLLALFPNPSGPVTQEIARLLAFQREPRMIEPALKVLAESKRSTPPRWADSDLIERNTSASYGGTFTRFLNNRPPGTAIRVAEFLILTRDQWTADQARAFFTFLNSLSNFQGGASYSRFIAEIRRKALDGAPEAVQAAAAEIPANHAERRPITVQMPKGPARNWTVDEAVAAIEEVGWDGATAAAGRNLFHAVACVACHQFDGEGGAIGPDLSNVRGKFDVRSLLESIIEPSKAISDQYGTYEIELTDGRKLTGLVMEGNEGEDLVVYVGEEMKTFPHQEVRSVQLSPISAMPPGLATPLNATELRDLLAYLLEKTH